MEYHVDSISDLAKLPLIDKIMGSSVVLIRPTGRMISLTETGWDGNL